MAFRESAGIPVSEPTPVMTFSPVVLQVPGRPVDLHVKVSVPATGHDLPVILLSHGHGPSNFINSLRGYGPLVDFWAARGFAVLQPTHLDSVALGLRDADDPDAPLYTRSRAEDLRHIIDSLGRIEDAVPWLGGRLDHRRIAVAGHSLGGHTAGLLCGMDGAELDFKDPRVKAGVLIAAPGRGEDVTGFAAEHYPILRSVGFARMDTPALVVAGEHDANPMFADRKDWRCDAYELSPGPKSRLLVYGAEHALGGISGYDAAETTDENPERVAFVRAMIWAYLRSALYRDDPAWERATAILDTMTDPQGSVSSRDGDGKGDAGL